MATIKKGHHRPLIPALGLYFNKEKIERKVTFHASCRYAATSESSINKLFGIGYFPSHHNNSARFGWKYNAETDSIDLFAYCYDNGERLSSLSNQHIIASVNIGIEITLSITVKETAYIFEINGGTLTIPKTCKTKLGYKLGVYFGGNDTAPHDIKISI
ncbi:MAG: hypothetical protein H7321_09320 [Bacteroidia bacterium]|nr:hypothetical protein [Bacteroidia bacterium]